MTFFFHELLLTKSLSSFFNQNLECFLSNVKQLLHNKNVRKHSTLDNVYNRTFYCDNKRNIKTEKFIHFVVVQM